MIRLLSLIFLCSLMGTWTFAADMKQNANAIQSKLDGNTFTAELSSGLHFNAKAPNVVIVDEKRVSPKKLDRQKAVFILPKTFSKAQASLYYCDDAETFCLPQQIDIAGSGQGAKSEKIVKKENATKSAKPNKHGFIEDDIAAAVAQAKKEKKLILADFSARWCPGCVRLETEIFNTAAFKGATKGFVKLKLDSDRFQNQELKTKYGIWAIPSLLVLTTDLDEVSRIVDYQPMPTLKRFFEDAQKTPQPFAVLKKKANSGDKTATEALGRRLYLAGKHAEALPYLEKVDPQPIEYLDAKAQAAMKKHTDPKQRGDLQRVLREVIAAEPSSTRSNVWRLALVEAVEKPAEKKKIALEGADLADDLLAHREKIPNAVKGDLVGEFAGYEPLLIASQKADLIAAGGFNEELEMEAWKQVTTIGSE
ncbi:MAG TPA: thioredoxin family protein, partial [Bdellovibrionales bacterium]|nr:thioredoxin family protein [Bdellovibrionales bacterium]